MVLVMSSSSSSKLKFATLLLRAPVIKTVRGGWCLFGEILFGETLRQGKSALVVIGDIGSKRSTLLEV